MLEPPVVTLLAKLGTLLCSVRLAMVSVMPVLYHPNCVAQDVLAALRLYPRLGLASAIAVLRSFPGAILRRRVLQMKLSVQKG